MKNMEEVEEELFARAKEEEYQAYMDLLDAEEERQDKFSKELRKDNDELVAYRKDLVEKEKVLEE